jgi:hypothetical protein
MKRAATFTLLVALLAVPGAKAAYDPVGAGATKLVLDRSFASFLKRDGITLSGAQGAKRKGTSFTLPITGGNLDPTIGKGEISQEGTLVFQSQRKKVPLRDIRLKTKHSPLIAKVGGSQLKVASSSKLSFQREGFDSSFAAKQLKLSAKVATRLNKKLRPKEEFKAGQLLGSLKAKAEPKLTTILAQNRATLVFASSFLSKLESRFVSVNPIFPAEHVGPTYSFPIIIGGSISPDASEGTLRTGGTVELLQLGGGQVFWQEPWLDLGAHIDTAEVDLEPTPAFAGKIGRLGVFDAQGGSVSPNPGARTISDAGISLTLTASTAKQLNEAFDEGKGLFAAGDAVGALSFVGQGQ